MKKNIAIASFVKTPPISPIKTRLAQTIGQEKTKSFYFLSLKVIEELYRSFYQDAPYYITPYWLVAEKEGLESGHWKNYASIWQREGNLGERLYHSYSTLLQQHDYVIFLGMDTPQLTKEIILESISFLEKGYDFVFGPALDGGFYLFSGKTKINKTFWTSVHYSKNNTLENLEKNLQKVGRAIRLTTTLRDVDTEEDLRALHDFWHEKKLSSSKQEIRVWIEKAILEQHTPY